MIHLLTTLVGIRMMRTYGKPIKNKSKRLKKDLFFISSLVVEILVLIVKILSLIFNSLKTVYKLIRNRINPIEIIEETKNDNIINFADYKSKKLQQKTS